jgi:acid phosphatase family membrane protein YuiD
MFELRGLLDRVNQPFFAAVVASLLAQVCKAVLTSLRRRRLDTGPLLRSGGMPSAHSALAVALVSSVAWQQGLNSVATAVSGVLAILILYDAAVIRRAAGDQARAINKLMRLVSPEEAETLYEQIGHSTREVVAGATLGAAVAAAMALLLRP